jgi:uncharacterized protein DUF4150/HNH/endonuclease VII toxin of polymorphic toxin system
MANQVFANFMEISCKAASGKTACSFPDVCFTPPQTPATPPGVPIPYPNTGFSSDTSDGSSTVKISNQEVMLKNKSYFKKTTGDEAGCAPKKGLINSKNTGKVYFVAWSMDVKFENENVVRNLDMTTHNHASAPANASIPWPHIETTKTGAAKQCKGEVDREQKACKDFKKQGKKNVCAAAGLNVGIKKVRAKGGNWNTMARKAMTEKSAAEKCLRARKCRLVPYNAKKDGVNGCCPSQTPDHLVPKSSFYQVSVAKGKKLTGWSKYKPSQAPCMCAEGPSNNEGSHGLRHSAHGLVGPAAGKSQTFNQAVNTAVKSAQKVFGNSNCSSACLKAQLKKGHEGMSKDPPPDVKHSPSGTTMDEKTLKAELKSMSTVPPSSATPP